MEDEDDDLYGSAEGITPTAAAAGADHNPKQEADASSGDEPMDEESADDDDDGDDDDDNEGGSSSSESDLDIIIDKPAAQPKPGPPARLAESKAIKIEPPPPSASTPLQPPKPGPAGTLSQFASTPGTAFPAQQTSSVDVNADPVYPPQGKSLLQVDIDADLAEELKIWRKPGEDQSDYFNYGLDEFTWELYRQRQLVMAQSLQQQKNDMAQMQQMVSMPGMPNMSAQGQGNAPVGAPSGPAVAPAGGMGAMSEEQQMQIMFQQLASQGMDPSQMDFGTFMQMAGQGVSGFGGPVNQAGSGFPQGNQGSRGARGGRGRGW